MMIRNFAIVAHVDHGKSTLADRLLEKTGVIKVGSINQALDTMDLERERGITIKLNPARMVYRYQGQDYQLNLIDTPGHVDFSYEVSRSLAAVEGVLLLIDASQGIQAQTLSHFHIAKSLGLKIIPVINKIDLPTARIEETTEQVTALINCQNSDICYISGKTGEGVDQLLETIVKTIPSPIDNASLPLRALVFDSYYDKYLGVVAYIKVLDGQLTNHQKLALLATQTNFNVEATGYMQIKQIRTEKLDNGEIGFIATGLKTIEQCRVGDTITLQDSHVLSLPGYQTPRPMVYASFFAEPERERQLGSALEKLKLNDASLVYEPISSMALGSGYTIGCLGLLHLDIIRERLEREYDISVMLTAPTVAYRFEADQASEPWVELEIIARQNDFGPLSELANLYRCQFKNIDYLADRIIVKFEAPLSEIIVDFYDRLKSATSGYGSMDYHFLDYRAVELAKVDLYIGGEKIDALSQNIFKEKAERMGREMVEKLKRTIPRQNYEVAVQAVIGGKIIARADIPAFRKDVTAKLYGGDVTRKRKLLEKQKKGKKKMRKLGKIEIPSQVFFELLRKD